MTRTIISIGLIMSLIFLLPLATCEVERLDIGTDIYWKTMDFEDSNWTSMNYDDSWWEDASNNGWSNHVEDFNANWIWYPGDLAIVSKTAYFRKTFNVPGNEILNGIIRIGLGGSGGDITLYINNASIGRWQDPFPDNPPAINITSYLDPGQNTIAAKVEVDDMYPGFILGGVIRYKTS